MFDSEERGLRRCYTGEAAAMTAAQALRAIADREHGVAALGTMAHSWVRSI